MSKNITIAEGGSSRSFGPVAKIQTDAVGGGTVYWVPEDEAGDYANLGAKTITANGTYAAASDNRDGYYQVSVNVAGADTDPDTGYGGKATGIDENGVIKVYTVDEDGYLQSSTIPLMIKVLVQPEITSYASGDTIDYTGMRVYALVSQGPDTYFNEDPERYPGGEIPMAELTLSLAVAPDVGGGGSGSGSYPVGNYTFEGPLYRFYVPAGAEVTDWSLGYILPGIRCLHMFTSGSRDPIEWNPKLFMNENRSGSTYLTTGTIENQLVYGAYQTTDSGGTPYLLVLVASTESFTYSNGKYLSLTDTEEFTAGVNGSATVNGKPVYWMLLTKSGLNDATRSSYYYLESPADICAITIPSGKGAEVAAAFGYLLLYGSYGTVTETVNAPVLWYSPYKDAPYSTVTPLTITQTIEEGVDGDGGSGGGTF